MKGMWGFLFIVSFVCAMEDAKRTIPPRFICSDCSTTIHDERATLIHRIAGARMIRCRHCIEKIVKRDTESEYGGMEDLGNYGVPGEQNQYHSQWDRIWDCLAVLFRQCNACLHYGLEKEIEGEMYYVD